jgi:hypothetical protein
VPAFPRDWLYTLPVKHKHSSSAGATTKRLFIALVSGESSVPPKKSLPEAGKTERAGEDLPRTAYFEGRSIRLPAQKLADIVGLAFADNQLQRVAEGYEPALTAQGAHFAHMVHVDDGIAVNPLELGSSQAVFDAA